MTKMLQPRMLPTFGQVGNLLKISAGLAASKLTGKPYTPGMPVMLMVEPTTACQLHCPHCPTGRGELTRPSGTMTLSAFKKMWDQIHPAPMLLQLWNQGEPLVNKETDQIIRHATETGSKVVLSTNVELLAKEELARKILSSGLQELILSLDGATPESHSKYRVGGKFELAEQGVRNAVKIKKELGVKYPILTWQFLLFRHNLDEVEQAKQLAKEWGVDRIVFKTAQLEAFEEEEGRKWLPDAPELRRYDLKNGRWVLRRAERPFCKRIFASGVVQWDGTLVPCCFDKDGDFVVGNVLEQPFEKVWRGTKFQRFRKTILTGKRPPMCANCTEGLGTHMYAKVKK